MSRLLDGLRILLFEDEPLIAMDVEQLCLDNGAAEVIVMSALDEINGQALPSFDVAIIDLILDGASTLDFARNLQRAGLPFIFASGHSEIEEIGLLFPDAAFVPKPYSGSDLMNAVAAACGRRSLT